MFISNRCISGLMPNLIKKSLTVSTQGGLLGSLYIVYLVGVAILYLSFFNVYFKCFRLCCILVVVLFLTSKSCSIQDALSARLKWSHCGDCGSQLNLDPLVMWHFCKGVINYHQLYCLGVTKAPTVDYCCPAIWCVVFAFYLP